MKKYLIRAGVVAVALAAGSAYATNGDNLEGIGAISEGAGGTGVAAPQDALTAVVNNPAGLAFAPIPSNGAVNVGATLFQPQVDAKISTQMGTYAGGSDDPLSVIPFVGYGRPLSEALVFGFGAYGVSGLGTDYRGQGWDLDGNPANGYEGDVFTKFASLKVAPALSYKAAEDLSLGAALYGDYSTLDMGQGESEAFGVGVQVGVVYRLGAVQLGASYSTPQKADFDEVYNFDAQTGDTKKDRLTLEQPAVYAVGASWQVTEALLLAIDVKQLAWASAEGYDAFDWEDQWVYAIGASYAAGEKLTLRAGFNYAENPVKEHNGWDPSGTTMVQGKEVNTMGYELLRTVGFPAIVESHLTLGFSYQISAAMSLDAAYMHAFEETISESSVGGAIGFESTLVEDSVTLALAWSFE